MGFHHAGVDLHTHTTASDGILAPKTLVATAVAMGVRVLAVTDHDTVGGVAEASAAAPAGLRVVPGVELSAQEERSVHVVGLLVRPDDPTLLAFFAEKLRQRQDRVRQMVARLRPAGVELDADAILASARGQPGRPHVARAMVEAGLVASVEDAFDRYLGRGKPGYVPYRKLSVPEAIRVILDAGGVPVLAHPGIEDQDRSIPAWVEAGLMGIEVFHPRHDREATDRYLTLARVLGLLVSGGSDYHGDVAGEPEVGRCGPLPEHVAEVEEVAAEVKARGGEGALRWWAVARRRRCPRQRGGQGKGSAAG